MMAVEGSGAEPAGTYRPTARTGTLMRSQTHSRCRLDAQGARLLSRVKRAHGTDRGVERCVLGVIQYALGGVELLRGHGQRIEPNPIEALGVVDQRRIAAARARHRRFRAPRPRPVRRRAVRAAAAPRGDRRSSSDFQSRMRMVGSAQASIFSTGSTSTELAPAPFSCSRVSQNTFSRHTACTATRSSQALERNDRRRLAARQELRDGRQSGARARAA